MNDIITVRGIVATIPRHVVTDGGLAISSFRLASPSRRWDRSSSTWANGDTNWYTVTAFRSLAANMQGSLQKGDRVVVVGRLRVRSWERDDRSGLAVEIDAESIGHDLAWGTSAWRRALRHTADETAHPGEEVAPDDRAALHTADGPLRDDPRPSDGVEADDPGTDLDDDEADGDSVPGAGPRDGHDGYSGVTGKGRDADDGSAAGPSDTPLDTWAPEVRPAF